MPVSLFSCTKLTRLEVFDEYKFKEQNCLDWGNVLFANHIVIAHFSTCTNEAMFTAGNLTQQACYLAACVCMRIGSLQDFSNSTVQVAFQKASPLCSGWLGSGCKAF